MKKILGVFVLSAMLAVPGMASAADPLPEGFIALSESKMNWADAKAFCEQQGGRLPLIDGNESLGEIPSGTTVDGFGIVVGAANSTRWHTALPNGFRDSYWTGTARTDTDRMWTVVHQNSFFSTSPEHPTASSNWAICVPK